MVTSGACLCAAKFLLSKFIRQRFRTFLQEVVGCMRVGRHVPVMFKRLYKTVIITDFVGLDKLYGKSYCCFAEGIFEGCIIFQKGEV